MYTYSPLLSIYTQRTYHTHSILALILRKGVPLIQFLRVRWPHCCCGVVGWVGGVTHTHTLDIHT